MAEAQWPAEGLERVAACPNCSAGERSLAYQGLTDDTFSTAPGRWNMYTCERCGCAYLDPRPSAETLSLAYATYYTHGIATAPVDGPIKAALRRWVKRFGDAYVHGVLLERRLPARDRAFAAIVRAIAPLREVIDAKYRHLRIDTQGRRVLDVGCGDATFLRRARELGWRGEGVDFDPGAVAAARAHGFDVRLGSVEAYARERASFDVITCNHVIEHVYDPRDLLNALYRLLKPGGRLWLETPNVESEGRRLFGRCWRGLETPRHLVLFNRDALIAAVEAAGFVVDAETPWNFSHIRYMFAASRALETKHRSAPRGRVPRWQVLRILLLEALRREGREFVLLRCTKPTLTPLPAPGELDAQPG